MSLSTTSSISPSVNNYHNDNKGDNSPSIHSNSAESKVYQEELEIMEFRTHHSRLKESYSFQPSNVLQYEDELGSQGHQQLAKAGLLKAAPVERNYEAKRVEPATSPTLPIIRKSPLYL